MVPPQESLTVGVRAEGRSWRPSPAFILTLVPFAVAAALIVGRISLAHAAATVLTFAAVSVLVMLDRRRDGGVDYLRDVAVARGEGHREPRSADLTALVLVFLFVVVLLALWVQGGRTFFSRDVGESHSIFLAAQNARSFSTTIVGDNAPSPDPAAHPYFYTHHPNLGARLLSIAAQRVGLDLENEMFLNILLSAVGLTLGYLAFERFVSAPFALGAVFFLVGSYTAFLENAVDLARSLHYVLFFVALYILSRDPPLARPLPRIALAATMALSALGDFAAFAFTAAFVVLWLTFLNRRFLTGSIVKLLVLPSALVLAFYFGVVWAAVGTEFFLFDLAVTYLGRSGQFVGTLYQAISGPLSALEIAQAYRDHNVVLWARAVQAWGIGDLLQAYGRSLSVQVGVLALPIVLTLLASLATFMVALPYRGVAVAVTAVVLIASWYKLVAPFALVVPVLAVVVCLCLTDRSRAAPDPRRPDELRSALAAGRALIVALMLSITATVAVFPEYGINFLVGERRPPTPLLEMAAAGLIVTVLTRLSRPVRDGRDSERSALAVVAVVVLVVLAGLYVEHGYRAYRRNPPTPPPYAAMLAAAPYRGASFLASTYYGVVWYYTRGWTNMSDTANPPRRPFRDNVNLRHFADWKNHDKYGHPDFYLCDNSRFRAYPVSLPDPGRCTVPNACDCRDVAAYMERLGYPTAFASEAYAISDLRGGGALN